jgi:NADPH:quinone reductase
VKAIRVATPGGPEALEYVDVERPAAGAGELLVQVEAIGVNFIDVYHRTGLYPLPTPFTPGSEAAGVVAEVGEGVEGIAVGDRVGFSVLGSYAEYAVIPAAKAIPLPEGIDARSAAAALLQGMTAHYLSTSTFPLKQGDTALVHAAAGGVGGILVQMAKQRGAKVFGTASTTKLDLVREAGADVAIDYSSEDFEEVVMRETAGVGVDVVYDSVARETFDRSLNCVATRGMLVMYGNSSGPVPPFDVLRLAKRSIFLTRPTLGHYTATREELLMRAEELFSSIVAGTLTLRIDRELPLEQAGEAHRLLEGRKTAGKLLLIP